jgi:hypothetical protein
MSQENDNFTDENNVEIIKDFSPLDAPVKQRSYTQHHIADADVVGDLEEPTFEPPSYSDFDEKEDAEPEPERPFNQSYSELDGKEKTMGAKMMAEMTLDLYEKGCGFLGKLPEISEGKLDRLIAEGEIDADIQIPTEGGNLGVKDFAREYNDSIKDAFGVSEEFKEKVKPPLERVFKKRGIGMTDEQLLVYYFATDIGAKGVQAIMLRKTANGILDSLKENTIAIREQSSRQRTPKPEPTQPKAQPKAEAKVETPSAEFTENISEVIEEEYVAPKRKKPATNLDEQVQYFEPEEMENGVYSVLNDNGGFKEQSKVQDNMPTFRNKDILDGIEKIEKESQLEKPVRKKTATKRTTTKRATTTRKPRK